MQQDDEQDGFSQLEQGLSVENGAGKDLAVVAGDEINYGQLHQPGQRGQDEMADEDAVAAVAGACDDHQLPQIAGSAAGHAVGSRVVGFGSLIFQTACYCNPLSGLIHVAARFLSRKTARGKPCSRVSPFSSQKA